jgi:anaerobic ribonucleoside-triphosphate reductase activating protein
VPVCPTNALELSVKELTDTEFSEVIEKQKAFEDGGITFSGGEPFCQAEAFSALADEIKKRNLDIVTFTGYTLEELREMAKTDKAVGDLLDKTDLLIDGPFINAEKDLTLQFRGSRNQRIIDMKATGNAEIPVLWEQK